MIPPKATSPASNAICIGTQASSIAVIFRFAWNSAMDAMRNHRYRLPAKFYVIKVAERRYLGLYGRSPYLPLFVACERQLGRQQKKISHQNEVLRCCARR
jgi:hypothetical protein